jgi:hypothetical protein
LPQWHPSARIKLCAPRLSRVDDGSAAFVAAGEALEGVPPGVGSFDVPASARLDRTSFVQVNTHLQASTEAP